MKIEERNEKIQAILQKHGIAMTDQLVVDFLVLLENEYDEGYSMGYEASDFADNYFVQIEREKQAVRKSKIDEQSNRW